mgnify:CR=1 FL=1
MQDLQVVEQNNEFYVDSREVAEMIEKEHKTLMRDIRTYISYIGTELNPSDFL